MHFLVECYYLKAERPELKKKIAAWRASCHFRCITKQSVKVDLHVYSLISSVLFARAFLLLEHVWCYTLFQHSVLLHIRTILAVISPGDHSTWAICYYRLFLQKSIKDGRNPFPCFSGSGGLWCADCDVEDVTDEPPECKTLVECKEGNQRCFAKWKCVGEGWEPWQEETNKLVHVVLLSVAFSSPVRVWFLHGC